MTELEVLLQILHYFQIRTVLQNSRFPRIKWEDKNIQGDFKWGIMHPHITLHNLQCQTLLMWSWEQTFHHTHPISWGSAHGRGCGVPVCSYKHTQQTAEKQVHPNWACLTRKRLNQLLNKRVHPFPPLIARSIFYHHNQHLSSSLVCEISWKKSIYVI